jgi:hypothetical protein
VALEWLAKAVDARDLNVYAMGADPQSTTASETIFASTAPRTRLPG